ncbi:gamma-glutamyltransferase [Heyndrickxia ginsengihumi]|uniref:Glutathione hydrolase proenzyme n=2 Tax=Heyndrickxia ginsengihumi TaxID=363870 RepID=A0A0A6VE02_9BACI|nr:gamma-glutamyltransferase [Heyndrickxia ginsengihumi]KHD84774.1 gamma-glutamyltranspeptidase [Heyndrickxia ginsengihumi]
MNKAKIGTKTMVVSPHYLASAAGARILEKGGNAFDAAVAVSACLAVVYPHMTGIGGDSFWLTWHQRDGKLRAYNGSGRSGYQLDAQHYADEGRIPTRGIRSAITVPGMVDSWDAILKEYGRFSFKEVLEPAITYALNGFPFSPDQYKNTTLAQSVLAETESTANIYLPYGKVPSAGQKFVQKDLGESLIKIAENGRDVFYKGAIAKEIVTYMRENDGYLLFDDFADHYGNWVEPISTTYHDYTVYQVPPNSQGFTALMALNILENYDFSTIKHGSYEYYHLLIEALKKAFRDRNEVLTDPEFSNIPLNKLLSKHYGAELAQEIQYNKAHEFQSEPLGSDTAYAAVVDEEGNAVSFIQSLYFEFGSAIVAGSTGILLQNRGSFFSLDSKQVNYLQPHKRTFHTLMPAMAFLDGKPSILYGTQGGEGQPQTQTALITRIIHYGMNPQEAVSEPRWVWGRTWGEQTEELKIEERVNDHVCTALVKAGHLVRKVHAYDGVMGHAHAIQIDEQGFRIGGTDPRCDGAALGW